MVLSCFLYTKTHSEGTPWTDGSGEWAQLLIQHVGWRGQGALGSLNIVYMYQLCRKINFF